MGNSILHSYKFDKNLEEGEMGKVNMKYFLGGVRARKDACLLGVGWFWVTDDRCGQIRGVGTKEGQEVGIEFDPRTFLLKK